MRCSKSWETSKRIIIVSLKSRRCLGTRWTHRKRKMRRLLAVTSRLELIALGRSSDSHFSSRVVRAGGSQVLLKSPSAPSSLLGRQWSPTAILRNDRVTLLAEPSRALTLQCCNCSSVRHQHVVSHSSNHCAQSSLINTIWCRINFSQANAVE